MADRLPHGVGEQSQAAVHPALWANDRLTQICPTWWRCANNLECNYVLANAAVALQA